MMKLMVIILVLCLAVPAYADLYMWKDSKGNTHFTDDEKKIPEQYRDEAIEASLNEPIVQSDYRAEPSGTVSSEEEASEYGGKPIFYWVQQINRMEADLIEARNTVTLLENELESLEHIALGQVRRNPVVGKYYSRPISNDSSLYFVDENEKKLLEMKLEQVKQQVKSVEQEMEIFKGDAKKTGVPPKYL